MSCKRCGAAMRFRDIDGDPSCLMCGYVYVPRWQIERAERLHAEMPKGARHEQKRRTSAEAQAFARRARQRERYARGKGYEPRTYRRSGESDDDWAERVADDLIATLRTELA